MSPAAVQSLLTHLWRPRITVELSLSPGSSVDLSSEPLRAARLGRTAALSNAAAEITSEMKRTTSSSAVAGIRGTSSPSVRAEWMPRRGTQLELEAVVRPKTWGGRRSKAGRKRAPGARTRVPHRRRAVHKSRHPVHVTMRAGRGLPSLRSQRISAMMRAVLQRQRLRPYAGTFQVVEFSIQHDHVHLIVEATGATGAADASDALRSGISGFVISFAKRLNRLLSRKGKVWGDRWHGRELATPSEVRNALVYVFRNVAKHGTRMIGDGVDPLSSGERFSGWTRPFLRILDGAAWPVAPPRTWLLGDGWRRTGLIDPREVRRLGA